MSREYDISAQKMFSGTMFTDGFMLEKAEREVERYKQYGLNPFYGFDHMFNFAVTMASVTDWVFHLKISGKEKWKGKDEGYFIRWIKNNSPEVCAFIDISNEFKHANRKDGKNSFAERMTITHILATDDEAKLYDSYGWGWRGEPNGDRVYYLFGVVQISGKLLPFVEAAKRAIDWWKSFDPEIAVPVSKAKPNSKG